MNRPTITATITIELKEEPPGSEAEHSGVGLEKRADDKLCTPPSVGLKRKAPSCSDTQDIGHEDNPGDIKRGCHSVKDNKQVEEDDPYAYGCRVVEEPPSFSHYS